MSQKKILIVEDDTQMTEMMGSELVKAGYMCFVAHDFAKAKEHLLKEGFDCILLDINLGEIPGTEVVKFLSTNKNPNSHIPIILVSGDLKMDIIKSLKNNIFSVILKPFKMIDLVARVDQACRKLKSQAVTSTKKQILKVLIVDDEEEFSNSLTSMLPTNEFSIQWSPSTASALQKTEKQRFDCIVVDLKLNETRTGAWIVKQLRGDKSSLNHKSAILVVSGFVDTKTSELNSLVQGIVEKPVSNRDMAQMLRDASALKYED